MGIKQQAVPFVQRGIASICIKRIDHVQRSGNHAPERFLSDNISESSAICEN